jgi:hypothetical protein
MHARSMQEVKDRPAIADANMTAELTRSYLSLLLSTADAPSRYGAPNISTMIIGNSNACQIDAGSQGSIGYR